ncbi:hypothetical protein CcCBS67573_g00085 [Chytriomyces confervae]|uniref:Alpha/beta hydrolase fold-3 domain-containing protein n=1 Tax=Chytriomyces confervae TaxID=246404 RepID=A0A507FUQ2_9FUNG|nr:hypothetical protein CcCBS67573_g00085 [Chytriomyces confervae]
MSTSPLQPTPPGSPLAQHEQRLPAPAVNNNNNKSRAHTPSPTSFSMPSLFGERTRTPDLDAKTSEPTLTSHPSWDRATKLAVNGIRVLTALTEGPVNLAKIRKVRSMVTLPTNTGVHIEPVSIPRRSDILIDKMVQEEAEGAIDAEWVTYDANHIEVGPVTLKQGDTTEHTTAVLYLHGGGYALCSRKTHRSLTWKVAKNAQARVLAIDYRLAPEHVYPLALHDAVSAYTFMLRETPADKIVIAGDSAGAGLALATALWLRDNKIEMPAGVALMSPWIDLSHSLPSFQHMGRFDLLREKVIDHTVISDDRSHFYVRDNSYLKNPYVSPLFASETDTPLPPILIQVGECERLRDESLVFATSNFKSNPLQLEIYEGMVHVFQMLSTFIKISDVALERFGSFIRKVTEDGDMRSQRKLVWVRNDQKTGFPVRTIEQEEIEQLMKVGQEPVPEPVQDGL